MKTGWKVLAVLTCLLLLVGLLWLFQAPSPIGSSVGLTIITNLPSRSSGQAVFRITNGYERAILLTDLIVETNSTRGWQASSHAVPTHPQRLATGDTKDLMIVPPRSEHTWRLRVTYGTDVKGPTVWMAKVDYMVSQHKWPKGYGIMAGSNSCISGEMTPNHPVEATADPPSN